MAPGLEARFDEAMMRIYVSNWSGGWPATRATRLLPGGVERREVKELLASS
jgi:hypothetical protein